MVRINMVTKKKLLKHYEQGNIHRFLQVDGWTGPIADDLIKPDKDNDWICCTETIELRKSPKELAVRVLIHEGTETADAIRLLKKIISSMKPLQGKINISRNNLDAPYCVQILKANTKQKKKGKS